MKFKHKILQMKAVRLLQLHLIKNFITSFLIKSDIINVNCHTAFDLLFLNH